MKYFIFVLLIAAFSNIATAQQFDFNRLDGPQVGGAPVVVLNNGTWVVAGGFHSTDGGTTWDGPAQSMPSSGGVNISNISPEGILLAGISWYTDDTVTNGIYRSSDFGDTWTKALNVEVPYKITSSKNGVYFVLYKKNASSNEFFISRSTDKGLTWTSVDNGNQQIFDITFDEQSNIYCYESYSGGNGFCRNTIDLSSPALFCGGVGGKLFPLSNQRFIASTGSAGYPGELYFTDGLHPWKKIKDSIDQFETIVSTADGTLWATLVASYNRSDNSLLYRSTDEGVNWEIVTNLSYSHESRIAISGDGKNTIFVGAFNGTYMTSDGGKTWKMVGIPAAYINSMAVDKSGILFVKDEYYNHISISYNSGKTWVRNDPDPAHVYIGPIGPGPNGTVIAPSFYDGCFGKNMWQFENIESGYWKELSPIPNAQGYGKWFLTTDLHGNIYTSVSIDGVYKSSDDGITWEILPLPKTGSDFSSMAICPDSSIYIGSHSGIYYSVDQGTTWKSINHTIGATIITALCAPATNIVIAGTSTKGLFKTTDNGSTWRSWGAFTDSITAILVTADNTVFVGTSRELYACSLGSDNWVKQDLHNELLGISCLAFDNSDGLLVGTTSGLWRAQMATSSVHSADLSPSELQIYPNPVTTTAEIAGITGELTGPTTIAITNIIGENVLNRSIPASEPCTFDATKLSAGIYEVKIVRSGKQFIGKFIKR